MPTSKLTLTVESQVIKKAKEYAKERKISLSKIVEFYFKAISMESEKPITTIPPITREISGMAAFETDKTEKELLAEALNNKFL